jgi:hypothetical protein
MAIKLTTVVDIDKNLPELSHRHRIMSMGSCFADNIGTRLKSAGFSLDANPFGVLYNPLSIAEALRQLIDGKRYTADDLICVKGLWHSNMHHGSFSSTSREEVLQAINARLKHASALVDGGLDRLIVTFGSAFVYTDRESGAVVSNCHKRPERYFVRRRVSVDEIVSTYLPLIDSLTLRNPQLKLLFTVSPIRHIRDGLTANQLSKSTLLLAVGELCDSRPESCFYFPSYEIVMDELRDYRFYADDLVHPSSVAVDYIWERFTQALFTDETRRIVAECESLCRSLHHRPLHPDSEEYKLFLGQIVLKIKRLREKYPYLELDYEEGQSELL